MGLQEFSNFPCMVFTFQTKWMGNDLIQERFKIYCWSIYLSGFFINLHGQIVWGNKVVWMKEAPLRTGIHEICAISVQVEINVQNFNCISSRFYFFSLLINCLMFLCKNPLTYFIVIPVMNIHFLDCILYCYPSNKYSWTASTQ